MISTALQATYRIGCAWASAGLLLAGLAGCQAAGTAGETSAFPTSLVRSQSPEQIPRGPVAGPSLGAELPAPQPAESAVPGGAQPRGPVLSVKIQGNRTVRESEIRRHIKTRQDRAYDPQLVQEDLRRLFATRKFHNVRVQKQVETQGVHVTFEVVERPLISSVLFIGNRYYSDKKLLKESAISTGDAMNIYMIQEARRKVEEFYHSKGFAKTRVMIAEGDEPTDRRVVLKVDEGRVERIWNVSFVGNDPKLATDGRLKTLIKSKPGILKYFLRGKVDYSLIEEDEQRLVSYYRGLGYFMAKVSREVEYDASNQWIDLRFVINEGPRFKIRDVSVVGNRKYDSAELIEFLDLKKGDFFNLESMQRDEGTLRDLYGSQGHIFTDIKASPRFHEEPGELDLVYQVEEGELFRVGKINISVGGEAPHTRRDVILNRLSLRPGDVIDIREVRASERRLKASQLFITNPAEGTPPRIVIRPPDLAEAASMAEEQGRFRGQSPDGAGDERPARLMVLDIFAPPFSGDQR